MTSFLMWALLLLGVLVAALAWFWLRRTSGVNRIAKQKPFRMEDWPPRAMRPLTPRELRTFLLFRRALPECLLLPQIALARFLSVNHNRSYNHWFASVGRRSVDFLICTEEGDILGAVQLQSSKSRKPASEGTQRKLQALEMAHIPVWTLQADDLPDAQTLRELVMPQWQEAQQHSVLQEAALQQASPDEVATQAPPANTGRWGQQWQQEDARSSDFLDQFGMIEVPPLAVKGNGRSAAGFTRG